MKLENNHRVVKVILLHTNGNSNTTRHVKGKHRESKLGIPFIRLNLFLNWRFTSHYRLHRKLILHL